MSLLCFGDFELDPITFQLRRQGTPVRIQQQPARVLALLASKPGALVRREEIRAAIWGEDTFVDFEQGLNYCVRQIRATLQDNAESPKYIETLPKLGYRFVAVLERGVEEKQAGRPSRRRIAVLPIEDFAGADGDYFGAGLTEDMIAALSRIDTEQLRVIAGPRISPKEISDAQVDELQRNLNLDYLLKGWVRRCGDSVRVHAQLQDLRDRSVLWAETYDRKSTDWLAVQEEVAGRVSRSLAVRLLPGSASGSRKYSRSPLAYDAYLKGRYFWHKMTSSGMQSSIHYFSEALAMDPTFAPAYAGLADCYAQMGSIRVATMKPMAALAKARPLLDRAMELDDTVAEAHCTLGLLKSWYELDWSGAEHAFGRALHLEPNNITALLWQSLLLSAMNRHEEAIESTLRARECEPLSPVVNTYVGVARMHAGQIDLSVRQLQQTIELDPGYYRAHMFLGRGLCWINRFEESIPCFQRALELNGENLESVAFLGGALGATGDYAAALKSIEELKATEPRYEPALLIATVWARIGDPDETFRWLRIAIERKSAPLYLLSTCDEFRRLMSDERYRACAKAVGLPVGGPKPPPMPQYSG